MHGSATGKLLRFGFVVLFGAMSIFHFPVMAFGGKPHSASIHSAGHSHHHDGHAGPANPVDTAQCDGFACFLAVEPALVTGRPLHAVLFGILRFTPADFVLTATVRPDLPPPRLQG